MGIDYEFCTDRISEARSEFIRAFDYYSRHNEYIKVGITCYPDEKELEHTQNEKWDKMVAVFESDSYDGAKEVETELFEYANESKHFKKVWDVLYHVEDDTFEGPRKYYVYFLVDNDCKVGGSFKTVISKKR